MAPSDPAARPMLQRVVHLLHTAPDSILDGFREKLLPYKRRHVNAQQGLLRSPDHIRRDIMLLVLREHDESFQLKNGEFPVFFRISGQLRDEAAILFFHENEINAVDLAPDTALALFSKIDAKHRALVKKVRVGHGEVSDGSKSAYQTAKWMDEQSSVPEGTWFVHDGKAYGILRHSEWFVNAKLEREGH